MIARIASERRRLLRSSRGQGPAATTERPALDFPWRLRGLPVCASTETELDRWLATSLSAGSGPLRAPMALLARHQRFGHGQQGRPWLAPCGGVWLSAALPWPQDPAEAAAPGLAMAVGLALQLEQLGLPVRLKWPNDLLLQGSDGELSKLAGLLPRLRFRGDRIRWARLGVGLNGLNPVPAGACNLRRALGPWGADPLRLAARVLLALEWAMAWGRAAGGGAPAGRATAASGTGPAATRRRGLATAGSGARWWPAVAVRSTPTGAAALLRCRPPGGCPLKSQPSPCFTIQPISERR